jgi:hypothetical protein
MDRGEFIGHLLLLRSITVVGGHAPIMPGGDTGHIREVTEKSGVRSAFPYVTSRRVIRTAGTTKPGLGFQTGLAPLPAVGSVRSPPRTQNVG